MDAQRSIIPQDYCLPAAFRASMIEAFGCFFGIGVCSKRGVVLGRMFGRAYRSSAE